MKYVIKYKVSNYSNVIDLYIYYSNYTSLEDVTFKFFYNCEWSEKFYYFIQLNKGEWVFSIL